MERKLDEVEDGHCSWIEFLRSFYGDFKVTMAKAEAEMDRVQKPLEELDETCPDCSRNLIIRTGRFGRFVSCSGFPECRYRRSLINKTGAFCPVCHGDLVERKTRQKKRLFYGCVNYPTCNFAMWEKPVPDLCPKCEGLMVIPKVGKDPVCYEEVIVPQKNAEERPVQDGEVKTTRVTRKKIGAEGENASSSATKRSTASRRKATSAVAVEDKSVEPIGSARAATKSRRAVTKTAQEVKTTKRTPSSTAKKTTTSRTKAKTTK
jgi:DNA topoisomerase-1